MSENPADQDPTVTTVTTDDVEGHRAETTDDDVEGHVQPRRDLDIER